MRRRTYLAVVGSAASTASGLAGCLGARGSETTDGTPTAARASTSPTDAPARTTVPADEDTPVAYTYGRQTGNRVTAGAGAVHAVDPVDVDLGGVP
ncbi:hypothetical protein [Haloarchaeobius sp. TZWSO28]|uniref:hypothetical protein n=1 Tax=Haloarchaeobius sp. TZWSO28 TaxID=3446119 RepID=UPI003EBF3514